MNHMASQQHQQQQQQHQQQSAKPIQFLGGSNIYVLQPNPAEKIICKDDNLKKMLAENDLLIDGTPPPTVASQAETTPNKNIRLTSEQAIKLIPSSQPPVVSQVVEKLFQLDGMVDDPKEDQPAPTPTPTSTASSKLAGAKVVINHELLSSYGITLTPDSQSSLG